MSSKAKKLVDGRATLSNDNEIVGRVSHLGNVDARHHMHSRCTCTCHVAMHISQDYRTFTQYKNMPIYKPLERRCCSAGGQYYN